MQELSEAAIRSSFGGCSVGERKRIRIPDLASVRWENIDFLSWMDRSDRQLGFLAVEENGRLYGLVLRMAQPGGSSIRQSMCNLCRTIHSMGGVSLFTTPKWGDAGKRGDTVGEYICADLECSAYLRGLKHSGHVQIPTSKTLDGRIEELRVRVATFLERATN